MATVSKPQAAERLITSGAIMVANGSDPLAVHVVAASALNLLQDLINHSGDNYVAQILKQGLYQSAIARLKGLPPTLPVTPEMDAHIDALVSAIDAGEVSGPEDLQVNRPPNELRAMLRYIVKPYNFLKHADNDPLAALDESDFDPKGALAHAIAAFSMLQPETDLPDPVKSFLDAAGII